MMENLKDYAIQFDVQKAKYNPNKDKERSFIHALEKRIDIADSKTLIGKENFFRVQYHMNNIH